VSEKYEFIEGLLTAAERCVYPVVSMCRWLSVSRSGFYDWRTRPDSATAARRGELAVLIRRSFAGSDETYGYRRVHAELARWGVTVGPELVRALMRELGLVPCQPRPYRHNLTAQDDTSPAIPDLVGRDFTAPARGMKMVGDITCIPTWEGWIFLATVIDCHSKKIIGWAMDDHYRTGLITTAIRRAAANTPIAPGAIFHSDRGSNYTSFDYGQVLAELGIRRSVGATGICYDNALAESFFGTLKNELVHRTVYPTRGHGMKDVARYIEGRYNSRRLHSGLGYRTPNEVHNAGQPATTAA
jgi:transposase InsO family protein